MMVRETTVFSDPLQPVDERLYLKCEDCGEVFDEIVIAHQHSCRIEMDGNVELAFSIVTESEAF